MSPFADQQLIEFAYAEARLLDDLNFDRWLELFTDDGYYWMPLSHGQTDPVLQGSLMYEDTLLLKIRIERLHGNRTYSQQPKSRCHHLLQRPTVETGHAWHQPDIGQYVVRCAFHYVETRGDTQAMYVGWSTFQLVTLDGQLRIRQKRVDLLNCDAALGTIQLFM